MFRIGRMLGWMRTRLQAWDRLDLHAQVKLVVGLYAAASFLPFGTGYARLERRHITGVYCLFAQSRSNHLTNARWRILIGIIGLALGAAYLVLGVLYAVTVAIPRHGLDGPYAAYLSSFGLGWLAFGYGVWWSRAHRWPQVVAVLALSVSAAVALSQVIAHWEQLLNSSNVGNMGTSLMSLCIVLLLSRLLTDNQQKRSR